MVKINSAEELKKYYDQFLTAINNTINKLYSARKFDSGSIAALSDGLVEEIKSQHQNKIIELKRERFGIFLYDINETLLDIAKNFESRIEEPVFLEFGKELKKQI